MSRLWSLLPLRSSSRHQQARRQRLRHSPNRRRRSLRAGLAVISGRAVGAISRRLHLGGGTSIVGVVAQRLYPPIVEHLASQLEYGSILVAGTNGKTTTSSFIAAILSNAGLRVWRNREGSNLMRGIASSLIIRAMPNGQLRRSGKAIAVLEVDEAVLPQAAQSVSPRVCVLTNLFRDQLDRYGEVDSVIALWNQAVKKLPVDTTLVLNADDPSIAHLGESFSGSVLYYGIDDSSLDLMKQQNTGERHQVSDAHTCPHCGSTFTYAVRFYSHIGHYSCPNCGLQRPQPTIRATRVQTESFDRLRIQVATPTHQGEVIIPLPGLYNVYNALAAIATAQALDIEWEPIQQGLEQARPAFGRGEQVQAQGRTLRLLLAKNPTGFNEVLRTLFSDGTPRHVLFILQDNIADGRDISWIWDVDFERAVGQMKTLVVGGTRALDLALRLKYAGVTQEDMIVVPPTPLRVARKEGALNEHTRSMRKVSQVVSRGLGKRSVKIIEPGSSRQTTRVFGLKNAIDVALNSTPAGETLFIVPTYTGLLEVHRELEQRGLTPHYWEE
jgi:UDP-N-acetylmuramyl tripeptide synthase